MTPNSQNENGWDKWAKHVLLELGRLHTQIERLDKKVNSLVVNHSKFEAEMKVKAGVWGAICGMIIPLAVGLVSWLKN